MYTHLMNRWDAIRDSFWFIPGVMSLSAMALAVVSMSLDGPLGSRFIESVPWVTVTTSAARSSLSAIGGAMVSIAGIVFSVMLVTLSITSSQYGSRLLRAFMSDRMTQISIGTLVGTSLFTMVSLAGIREGFDGTANVAVIVGLLLAILSMTILIGFIHHVANLIQAPNVMAAVADDLNESIDRIFPDQMGDAANLDHKGDEALPADIEGAPVRSKQEG